MATTALNNFMDFKRAKIKEGYNYEEHNAMVRDQISDNMAITLIVTLVGLAALAGIFLFYFTDEVILLIGFAAFAVAIAYSYGPLPISRTPLGEIFSGVLMGGVIYFVTIYIHIFDLGLVIWYMNDAYVTLQVNWLELLVIGITAIPLVFLIANIMLANNICDMEEDHLNQRYTLPIFIGKKYALAIWSLLYLGAYGSLILGVALGLLPLMSLAVVVTGIPVIKLIKAFNHNQDKATTFSNSVKIMLIFRETWILSYAMHFGIVFFI